MVDNGRGIPVDMHEEEGVSAAEVVMTKLHAGGKFDSNSYKVSGGLHGVGVSCVNALSERLELEIWREGFTWQQEYACGHSQDAAGARRQSRPQDRHADHLQSRTPPSWRRPKFNFDTLAQRLRELAFLNKGLKITLTDEREEPEKTHEFLYSGGIAEFIKHLNRGKVGAAREAHLLRRRAGIAQRAGTLAMEVALQYNDGYSENLFSFANNINTVDGGTHLSGFRSALTRTINAFGQQAGLFKDVKENLTGDDVREGLTAVVSVKLPQPQFEGQTKGKLNSDIAGYMTQFVNDKLGEYFDKNPAVMKQDRLQGDRRGARARSRPQSARSDPPQRRARFRRPARQAGRLPGARSGALRAVPGGGRIGRRHRQAGPRPALPGHSAAEGQDPERGEGALRQDAGPRGNPQPDHGASAPASAKTISTRPSSATARSSS